MVMAHAAWLGTMRPADIRAAEMEGEARTGKVRLAQRPDRHGRPILVFDNSKENTWDAAANIRHLVFHLWRAVAALPPGVDKFCIFIHLADFSLWSSPPIAVTRETLSVLLDHFPERLGHCVLYQAPWLFSSFYSAACVFIDEKTQSKIRCAARARWGDAYPYGRGRGRTRGAGRVHLTPRARRCWRTPGPGFCLET